MRQPIDLLNRRFGKLLVIEIANKNKQGAVQWKCLCDCGNEKIIIGSLLKTGRRTHCGCVRSRRYDTAILGRKFGLLTVLEYSHTEKKKIIFLCQCDCG